MSVPSRDLAWSHCKACLSVEAASITPFASIYTSELVHPGEGLAAHALARGRTRANARRHRKDGESVAHLERFCGVSPAAIYRTTARG